MHYFLVYVNDKYLNSTYTWRPSTFHNYTETFYKHMLSFDNILFLSLLKLEKMLLF